MNVGSPRQSPLRLSDIRWFSALRIHLRDARAACSFGFVVLAVDDSYPRICFSSSWSPLLDYNLLIIRSTPSRTHIHGAPVCNFHSAVLIAHVLRLWYLVWLQPLPRTVPCDSPWVRCVGGLATVTGPNVHTEPVIMIVEWLTPRHAGEKRSPMRPFLSSGGRPVLHATFMAFAATRCPMYLPRVTSANPPEASILTSASMFSVTIMESGSCPWRPTNLLGVIKKACL